MLAEVRAAMSLKYSHDPTIIKALAGMPYREVVLMSDRGKSDNTTAFALVRMITVTTVI